MILIGGLVLFIENGPKIVISYRNLSKKKMRKHPTCTISLSAQCIGKRYINKYVHIQMIFDIRMRS